MQWWMKNLPHMFTVIHQKTPSVCIYSDASNLAWSSSSGEQETGGCWNDSKINKSPKGTNVCAVIEVKRYGGCLEVCRRPSNEEKVGAIFGDNRGIPK